MQTNQQQGQPPLWPTLPSIKRLVARMAWLFSKVSSTWPHTACSWQFPFPLVPHSIPRPKVWIRFSSFLLHMCSCAQGSQRETGGCCVKTLDHHSSILFTCQCLKEPPSQITRDSTKGGVRGHRPATSDVVITWPGLPIHVHVYRCRGRLPHLHAAKWFFDYPRPRNSVLFMILDSALFGP